MSQILINRILKGSAKLNAIKQFCIRGHLLEGKNIRIRKDGSRYCKICDRLRKMIAREPKKVIKICNNPRCYKEISFGIYCPECQKLAQGRKIPNTIICEICKKEVVIKRQQKKRFCNECKKRNDSKRSLDYYYSQKEIQIGLSR